MLANSLSSVIKYHLFYQLKCIKLDKVSSFYILVLLLNLSVFSELALNFTKHRSHLFPSVIHHSLRNHFVPYSFHSAHSFVSLFHLSLLFHFHKLTASNIGRITLTSTETSSCCCPVSRRALSLRKVSTTPVHEDELLPLVRSFPNVPCSEMVKMNTEIPTKQKQWKIKSIL